jgi:hypothetical protein
LIVRSPKPSARSASSSLPSSTATNEFALSDGAEVSRAVTARATAFAATAAALAVAAMLRSSTLSTIIGAEPARREAWRYAGAPRASGRVHACASPTSSAAQQSATATSSLDMLVCDVAGVPAAPRGRWIDATFFVEVWHRRPRQVFAAWHDVSPRAYDI